VATLLTGAAKRFKVPMELALEVGCSVGGVTLELARSFEHVTGIDLDGKAVAAAVAAAAEGRVAVQRKVRHHSVVLNKAGQWQCSAACALSGPALALLAPCPRRMRLVLPVQPTVCVVLPAASQHILLSQPLMVVALLRWHPFELRAATPSWRRRRAK
jgi:hypothetical protein